MKKIVLALSCICLISVLTGCQISKNEVHEDSGMVSESKTGDIIQVENGEADIEKAVEAFSGKTLKEVEKYDEDPDDEDAVSIHKRKFSISYFKRTREGLGPDFSYADARGLMGDRYNTVINSIFGSRDDPVDCRMREIAPEEDFPDCDKEHILDVCNPGAFALGYTSENSLVDCYAISSDMLKEKGEEFGVSGPIAEIEKIEDYKKLSEEERQELEKKNPWKDTDRAVYVVYRPIINGKELASSFQNLHMIYQPDYDKVIYVDGRSPWKIASVEKKEGVISEKEAVAAAKMIWQVRQDSDVEILRTELVYSQDYTVWRENQTISLCYRVDMKLLNRKDKQGVQAYGTVLVDAFSGERVQMWPGLGE